MFKAAKALMSDHQRRSARAPGLLIIAQVGKSHATEELAATCARANYAVRTIASPREAAEAVADPATGCVILSGARDDRRTAGMLAAVRAADPTVAVVMHSRGEAPSPDWLREADVLGAFSSLDTPEALMNWVRIACEMTANRRALAALQEDVHDLRALNACPFNYHQRDEVLQAILHTSFAVVSRHMPKAAQGTLRGAVLLAGESGELVVGAATPPYEAGPHRTLPAEAQQSVRQVMDRRAMLATGERMIIPFIQGDRPKGALFLEGSSLPTREFDALKVLTNRAEELLENFVLFELAAIDGTTRLYSRSFMFQRTFEALKAAYRTGLDFTILMTDLNEFKVVNDQFGHLVGDRVLRDAGQLMRKALRDTDILGRYGGDEFLLALPNTSIRGGWEVALRIVQNVQDYRLEVGSGVITLSICIGIGGITHEECVERYSGLRLDHEFFQRVLDALIVQADGLMYHAKGDPVVQVRAGVPLSWMSMLRQAGLLESDAL